MNCLIAKHYNRHILQWNLNPRYNRIIRVVIESDVKNPVVAIPPRIKDIGVERLKNALKRYKPQQLLGLTPDFLLSAGSVFMWC